VVEIGIWDKIKEFDKMMSEPAFEITIIKFKDDEVPRIKNVTKHLVEIGKDEMELFMEMVKQFIWETKLPVHLKFTRKDNRVD